MKKTIFTTFLFLLIFNHIFSQAPYGVWMTNQDSYPNYARFKRLNPYLTGVMINYNWKDLDTGTAKKHAFNWKKFDDQISSAADAGFEMQIMVFAGPSCPDWVYDSVPFVKTNEHNSAFSKYPYYLDPSYQRFWYAMINVVITHIYKMKPSVKNKVLIYQSTEGTTGDLDWYKGDPLNSNYIITGTQWATFVENAWLYTDNVLRTNDTAHASHLLVNTGGPVRNSDQYALPSAQVFQWVTDNLPNAWRKGTFVGHLYQGNYESSFKTSFDPLINQTQANGNPKIRCRDELDFHQNSAFFYKHLGWNTFYTAASALDFGLDIWCVPQNALTSYPETLKFFSRYAGIKDPSQSPGAFCVLHDGLDAADSTKFPVPQYPGGTPDINKSGENRCKSIANSMAKFGAGQNYSPSAQGAATNILNDTPKDSLNDVGWYIHSDNYERYLHQIDIFTGASYWRIGSSDSMAQYGRFAKGFNHNKGEDTLFFDIDNNFLGTMPVGGYSDTIKVVYWDSGYGSWQLCYNSIRSFNDTFPAIKKLNTTTWKTAIFIVSRAQFKNRAAHHADFYITSYDTKDDIFAMVEILREQSSGRENKMFSRNTNNENDKVTADKNGANLIISPNPAVNNFTVQLKNNNPISLIKIYSVSGNVVFEKQTNSSTISLSRSEFNAASGIYFVEVWEDKNVLRGKLVIQ